VVGKTILVAVLAGVVAGCGGSAAGSPSSGGAGASVASKEPVVAASPEASTAAAGAASGSQAGKQLVVTIDGKTVTYEANCAIDPPEGDKIEKKSIRVEGANGGDTAVFVWKAGEMPYVEGTTGGTAWKAPDLNAAISFSALNSWTFNGSVADTGASIEGTVVCN
jgi:hypothetical protein